MKQCINCAHVRDIDRIGYEKCGAPKNGKESPINGKYTPRWIFCETHRDRGFVSSLIIGTCGKRGRWFEPKEDK